MLIAMLLGLLLVVQLPRYYPIDVGVHEGYGGDLPLLWGFNTPEDDEHGTYRWTQDGATIRLPGMGQRPLLLQLDYIPISAAVIQAGPKQMELWLTDQFFTTLPVAESGRQYTLLIPPRYMPQGTLDLTIHTATFTPPDDPRTLGTPLDMVRVVSTQPTGTIALPAWDAVWQWMLAVVFFWLVVARALYTSGYPSAYRHRWAAGMSGMVIVLIIVAAWLDPSRWGYGATPAVLAAGSSLLVLLVIQPLLPRLFSRLHLPVVPWAMAWLLLIAIAAFGVRFGGRLYPLSMWGDIGFHANRFIETFGLGELFLVSRNRGVNFPYPPGTYLVQAPLILLDLDLRFMLQLVATLLDGLSVIVVYSIVIRASTGFPPALPGLHNKPVRDTDLPLKGYKGWVLYCGEGTHEPQQAIQWVALLAAALYGFTAAGIMLTWWSFATHIYTQGASVVLIAGLIIAATSRPFNPTHSSPNTGSPRWAIAGVGVLLTGVFLGHFGFLINVVLMGGLLLVWVWGAAFRGSAWAQRVRFPLLITYLWSGFVSLLFFYLAFLPLFLYQFNQVSQGGLTELADRAPVGRDRLWDVLWHAGLVEHFGFFPLLLMAVGIWRIYQRGFGKTALNGAAQRGWRVLFGLMVCSLIVSSFFAILPFITLSTQSTRWMMFSAWVMAIGAAFGFRLVWRYGRAGRVTTLAMGGFVVWNTAYFWLAPMLWRIRPPEPF
jgi:hypothetical protein